MPATIHDVAKKAGVGIGTVSSVLNNSRPVNKKTRQKVMAAIDELDFVPNPSGRRLSMGKTNTIGIVIPFFTISSQIERLRGVMSVIAGSDYDISLYTIETVPQRNKVLQTIPRRGHVDGLIIFSITPTENDLQRILQEKLPTVYVEGYNPKLHSISLDDTSAARNAVEHLISLGHRRIGYVGDYLDDPFGTFFSRNRYRGYCQALKEADIPIRPEYHRQGWYDRDAAKQMTKDLFRLASPPTAIFAFSDEQALGILETAREMEISVPEQLSVVGYDDIQLASFAQLTTVRQNLFESGITGTQWLLELIDKPEHPPRHIEMQTQLMIRHTTAPPP